MAIWYDEEGNKVIETFEIYDYIFDKSFDKSIEDLYKKLEKLTYKTPSDKTSK